MISNSIIRFLIILLFLIISSTEVYSQDIISEQKPKRNHHSKLILKNAHTTILTGKIIRIYKKGIIFDPKRESLLFDPKDEFYSFDEIWTLSDENGNIIIDSLSNKNIDYEKYDKISYKDSKLRKKKFGIKAGHNYSYFHKSTDARKSNLYQASLFLGVFVENNLSSNILILNELYFSQQLSESSVQSNLLIAPQILKYKASYLHFDLLMKLKTNKVIYPYFLFGFDIGYLFLAKDKRNLDVEIQKDITNKLSLYDYSIIIGVGKRINLEKVDLLLEVRYLYGLTEYSYFGRRKYNDFGLGVWQNRQFQILLGFQF